MEIQLHHTKKIQLSFLIASPPTLLLPDVANFHPYLNKYIIQNSQCCLRLHYEKLKNKYQKTTLYLQFSWFDSLDSIFQLFMGFSIKSTFNLIQRKCKYTLRNANISSNARLITAELNILRIIIQFNRLNNSTTFYQKFNQRRCR